MLACDEKEPCPLNYVCDAVDGFCAKEEKECPLPCGVWEQCVDGRCTKAPCKPDAVGVAKCPAGHVCEEDGCVPPACSDGSCPANQTCVNGACLVRCDCQVS